MNGAVWSEDEVTEPHADPGDYRAERGDDDAVAGELPEADGVSGPRCEADGQYFFDSLKAGACGYVLKSAVTVGRSAAPK
jgi:hypothetical protein